MIWQRLSPIWQTCVAEAWQGYCHGSLPHGAVVTDAQGRIVSHGRNRIREKTAEGREFAGNRLAHAELNALLAMDWSATDVYSCKLYSIVEPCPMCIGALRMAHMREIHYAARDSGAGATSLIDKTAFFASGQIAVFGSEDSELEQSAMALMVEATLSQRHPQAWDWINQLARELPRSITLGNQLFEEHLVAQWCEEGKAASFVLDQIHERLLALLR
ncbi:MAG TPA: nucleoside deaminase [Ktedonobacteraceae bacterium]